MGLDLSRKPQNDRYQAYCDIFIPIPWKPWDRSLPEWLLTALGMSIDPSPFCGGDLRHQWIWRCCTQTAKAGQWSYVGGVEDGDVAVCRQELLGSTAGRFHPHHICYRGCLAQMWAPGCCHLRAKEMKEMFFPQFLG